LTPRHPRLLLCCGEPSGDLYGAELLGHLRRLDPDLEAFGLGGDRLRAAGLDVLCDIRELAVVGLVEVLSHLRRIWGVFRLLLGEAERRRPDVAVLIDYPDFNMRLARRLRARGIPVVYYVSPQVWAWRRGRIREIRETVSHMIVLFPFEVPLYRDAGVPATFVGHPLVDLVRPVADRGAFLLGCGLDPARPVVGLLPGSRRKEVAFNLPPILGAVSRVASHRPDVQFLLAAAPSLDIEDMVRRVSGLPVRVVAGQAHSVLSAATVAVVASGTATVEAALLGAPMIVVYRISALTYALGRRFVHVPHFAMANLIAGRRVVPELIQADLTPERVTAELLSLLGDQDRIEGMRRDLLAARDLLGEPGASGRAAEIVDSFLRPACPPLPRPSREQKGLTQ
jgi:lipid-A-disaccharide synthase